MPALLRRLVSLHDAAFDALERAVGAWLPTLVARFAFASALLLYYWTSALTKIGDGPLGVFDITDGAYVQILPSVMEAYGYDAAAVPFLPWGLIVALGTYAEFVLPFLVLIGLATRLSALGMIVFIVVQSWVDIAFHHVDAKTVGAMFDRFPDAAILDQRLLWIAPLVPLVVRGAGALSVDAALARRVGGGVGATRERPATSAGRS